MVIVRKVKLSDANELISYCKRVGSETDNLTYGSEGIGLSIEEEKKFIEEMDENSNNIFICALEDDKIIGIGNLNRLPRRTSHRSGIGLSVIKDNWGRGVGSLLLNELIEFARSREIEIISLKVRSDNIRAIKFYEKFGFKKLFTIPKHLKIRDEYYDADFMVLSL